MGLMPFVLVASVLPMSKSILALDQSTRVSGWAFYDGELVDFGHWENTHEDLAIRINKLCQQIQSKIDIYEPELIIIENIQMQHGDVQTFQKLAQVQGAIMNLCVENEIDYKLVYPSEWRKECNFLKGNDLKRENQKKIAQQWVKDTYGMKCTQDEADAICIGFAENKEQNECLTWD